MPEPESGSNARCSENNQSHSQILIKAQHVVFFVFLLKAKVLLITLYYPPGLDLLSDPKLICCSKLFISMCYKNNLCLYVCMDGFTRHMTLEPGIMTTLNSSRPLSNTTMYDFRKRPGGPCGEPR